MSELSAGTLLTARAVGMFLVSSLAVLALRRTGLRLPMIVGFLLTGIGIWMSTFAVSAGHAYAWLSLAAAVSGIGNGIALPASNNASLHLAPQNAAVIGGLRGMFRQTGAITGLAIASTVVARSGHPIGAQSGAFIALAALMVLLLPAVFLVPEHRGSW